MKLNIFLLTIFITTISLAQDLKPTDTEALLNVTVNAEDGSVSPNEFLTFTNKETGAEYSGKSDETGKFSLLIPKGAIYIVNTKGFSGDENKKEMEIPAMDGPVVMNFTMVTQRLSTFILDVHFETNSAVLKPNSFDALNQLFDFMEGKKNVKIEIGGHTDDVGSDESNLKLSQARAESVREYLTDKNVAPARIIAKGYGETKPVASNETPEGRQQNRRTEVKILTQ